MTYTIPSYTVRPGSVYQPPGGVPGYIKQNARALYAAGLGAAFDSTKLLDQSPLHLGTRRAGREGQSINLNGTNQAGRVADNTALDITDNLTVSVWAKNDNATLSSPEAFFAKYDGTGNNREWQFYFDSSEKLNIGFGNPADGTFFGLWTSTNVIAIDSIKHYGSTVASGTLKVYVNGLEIAGSLTSGSVPATLHNGSADLTIGSSLASNVIAANWDGQIFDARIYAGDSTVLTAAQILSIYEDGPNNVQFDGQSLRAHYKCDEEDGVTCYDSSGNGNNGTVENAVLPTIRTQQNILSFANQVGYNLSGSTVIPRDESDPTNDVLGNPLTYTGIRPNDASLINSSCLTADGTLYIAAAHLAGTETVVRSGGTSTPSISAGRIDFTAGTCWDLLLSDGTYYPLADCWGTPISNAAVDGDGGVLTNATLASAWGATQDEFHYNILNGFSLYEHASTAAIRVPFVNGSARSFTPPTGYTLTAHYPVRNFRRPAETEINFNPDSTPEMGGQLGSYTAPAAHAFGDDMDPGATDQGFARQATGKEDRFAIFPEAQTGGNLTTIERWTT